MKVKILMMNFLAILVLSLSLSGCNFAITTFNQKVEVDAEPSMAMFLGGKDNINVGELYYQSLGNEKEKIADTALKDEFIIAPKTQSILLLNNENDLYLKQQGKEKIKVASGVIKSSYCFSNDEQTIAFLVESTDENNPAADLYIQKLNSEKEKITSGLSKETTKSNYSLSDNGTVVFFLNADHVLYSWTSANNKEKLANDVKSFNTYANSTAYSYINTQDVYYVKFSNDSEAQKISISGIGNLRITQDGMMALFTGTYNWEKNYGELYAVIKGSDSIKIASNVRTFADATNNNLYYVNDESSMYLKKLPKITKDSYKNISKFTDEINKGQKDKICSDVTRFEISPNGKNSAFIDSDNNLYLSYEQKEKVKIASDIVNVRLFDNSILFQNKDNQLYLNSVLSDAESTKDNNKMIAQLVTNFTASASGKYIAFTTTENNSLMLCIDGAKPESLITDSNIYDTVVFQNQTLYEKKLMLSDIVGIYKNSDLGVAYKITGESQFLLYEKGEEKENSKLNIKGLNRLSAGLNTDNKDSILSQSNTVFSTNVEGNKFISLNDAQYELEVIDEDGLTQEINRQKKVEADEKAAAERKAAAEKAAAELKIRKEKAAERGRTYLQNGVYVSSYQTLYYSPNYSSASGLTYNSGGIKNVYDYEVSSDGNTIWLKLYTTSSGYGGYTGYIWVAE